MSSAFSSGIGTLLEELRHAERNAELVQKFVDTGGSFRVRIAVDHPDADVKQACEYIASNFIPSDPLVRALTKFSNEAVEKAKANIAGFAISGQLDSGVAA